MTAEKLRGLASAPTDDGYTRYTLSYYTEAEEDTPERRALALSSLRLAVIDDEMEGCPDGSEFVSRIRGLAPERWTGTLAWLSDGAVSARDRLRVALSHVLDIAEENLCRHLNGTADVANINGQLAAIRKDFDL